MLPRSGSVAGIDVGYSKTRESSAICRLHWDADSVCWDIIRYRAVEPDRTAAFRKVIGAKSLLSVAIDGPLQRDFAPTESYRSAERMLTRRLAKHIGKPGQASTLVGRNLNSEAIRCARLSIKTAHVAIATHYQKIASQCIVEAFPTPFLGLMLEGPLKVPRAGKSDVYFSKLEEQGVLKTYLECFFPKRALQKTIADLTNHDDRAAFVCALTALAIASGNYSAVGGDDGWIILPHKKFIRSWAWSLLKDNAADNCGQLTYSP